MSVLSTEKFHSPGKLLLTGEYFVLDGAQALAVPTQMGQSLVCRTIDDTRCQVEWKTFVEGKYWFSVVIDYRNWMLLQTNIPENARFILNTLKIIQQKSEKFEGENSFSFEANIEFPSNFGLGSSSTLMTNLANWSGINPFELNEKALGGSGYDIAVAVEKLPVLYQLLGEERRVRPVVFSPKFAKDLIFIHLNKKQDSREGIRLYRAQQKSDTVIRRISELTQRALNAEGLSEFAEVMTAHEREVSEFLGLRTVKERLFLDCPSFVKSLGAWGGDFVMSSKFEGYQEYFSEKGFNTVVEYQEIIG